MRILTWNLNHRAARRQIPDWVAIAIDQQQPDVAVLTEYVQGEVHGKFVDALAQAGLLYVLVSDRTVGQNQILIVSKTPLVAGRIFGPGLHSAVPSNTLHAIAPEHGLQILGFRMPAFDAKDKDIKLAVWKWLIDASRFMESEPAVVTGDMNTALGDSVSYGGDFLGALPARGWQHAIPATGYSWRNSRNGTVRRIDHTFLSPMIAPAQSRYLWDFQSMAPDAHSGRPGIPDHAMLVVDF